MRLAMNHPYEPWHIVDSSVWVEHKINHMYVLHYSWSIRIILDFGFLAKDSQKKWFIN